VKTGRIKTYNSEKHFGFITPDGGGPDIHFSERVIVNNGFAIEEGAAVEYESGPGIQQGKETCKRVRIKPMEQTSGLVSRPSSPVNEMRPVSTGGSGLPAECVFKSFYGEDSCLRPELFYKAPEIAAEAFRRSGFTSSQLRQAYQALLHLAAPLRDGRRSFSEVKERFGVFYVERIVRQAEREKLPPVVKELFDRHRELALSAPKEMLGLFRYVTNILCYFGDKEKN
jgi:CspA family cold shock protein